MDESPKLRFRQRMLLFATLSVLILLAAATFLNVRLGHTARQAVRDQFNEAQLVVARSISYWVKTQIDFLEKELRLAAENIGGAVTAPPALDDLLQPCLARVAAQGVVRIGLHDSAQRLVYALHAHGLGSHRTADTVVYPESSRRTSHENQVISESPSVRRTTGADGADMHFTLSIPLNHPVFSALSFQINPSWFLTPFLRSIRSAKTGYAWIIDAQGRFLFHPQPTLIGQNALKGSQHRDADMAHHLIDTIQSENMLKGKEGAGFYYSGWHRGATDQIEKLIAYSPVILSEDPALNWSVAVVAPVWEIEDALRQVHYWQVMLQGFGMLVLVMVGSVVLLVEIRWSRQLENTVQTRTLALKRSEDNYHSLMESAEDFIFTLDQAGRLLSVNSYTANWFGSRPGNLIGHGLECLFDSQNARRQHQIIQTVFKNGKSICDEFELRTEHTQAWFRANFMPLKSEAGRMTAVLCIARDITEHKKLESNLINTEKLASLGTLAAGVAHEINNPLGVILGFCDLLARTKDAGSQEYEDLKIIERQGLHCRQVVENLLSFARVGREVSSTTNLNACLQEVIGVVRHSLEMKAIVLRLDLAENLPEVTGDNRQLQQVFLNLINNAGAAMPQGGRLSIYTGYADDGNKVVARICDQGSGIAPEIMEHIFEPFFTTKPEGEGTGLGLFVSYGIIHKFGGSLTCESHPRTTEDGPGGATFVVALPLAGKWEV